MTHPLPARRPATYDDLLAVPDHLVAEIVDGELHTTPRPTLPHTVASSRLGGDLIGPFDAGRGGPGGWWILFEPELHLGADIVVPDVAGWRRSPLPEVPRAPYATLAPDWVCETLSASTESLDRGTKLRVYAREAVGHVWLLNPERETLEVYRLDRGHWLLVETHAGDVAAHIEPFEAVELQLWRLWGRSQPRP